MKILVIEETSIRRIQTEEEDDNFLVQFLAIFS